MDAWLLLRDIESGGERNRGLYILKARGIAHSNQIREFLLTDHGVELREVYLGEAGLLTGSARLRRKRKTHPRRCWPGRKLKGSSSCSDASERRWTPDRRPPAGAGDRGAGIRQLIAQEKLKVKKWEEDREDMARSRFVNTGPREANGGNAKARGGRQ